MRWRRQVEIPASARAALALEPGERVLAVATASADAGGTGDIGGGAVDPGGGAVHPGGGAVDPGGGTRDSGGGAVPHVIATDRALHVPAAGGGLARIGYESIAKVSWDGDPATLTVVLPEPDGRLDLRLAEPGYLPETVRERVQSTIVYSQHVPLDGRRGVLVSARRAPGTGQTRWVVVFDAGLDRTDPGLRERAERVVAELRAQTGI